MVRGGGTGKVRRCLRRVHTTAEEGFTLVELMVTFLILSLVMAGVAITMSTTLKVTTQGIGTVTGTNSANTAANALLLLLEGSVFPQQAGYGQWADNLNSPVVVACPEELMFMARPPSAEQNVTANPVWVFAFIVPLSQPTTAGPFKNLWRLRIFTFQPGHNVALNLYGAFNGCPRAPNYPTFNPGQGNVSAGPASDVDTTSSFYVDLSNGSSSTGNYNAAASTGGSTPTDQLLSPPSAFSYVNGFDGSVSSEPLSGPSFPLSAIVAVRIYVTGKAAGALLPTTTAYQATLTSVLDNPSECFPYLSTTKPACFHGAGLP